MTWTKLGAEFVDECAHADLSDAAFRTHVEGIAYAYRIGADPCRFPKRAVRRFGTSESVTAAIEELARIGWWKDDGPYYEIVHHADVIADSLAAQRSKRERDRRAQQAARDRRARATAQSDVTDDVSADVSADTRQTDRQTDSTKGEHSTSDFDWPDPWPVDQELESE